LFSPELHGAPGVTIDELRDAGGAATTNVAAASNTQFEIYAAGTAVAPYATPAPGTSTLPNLPLPRQATYTPVTTNDAWVRFYTISAGSPCGAYVLRAETVGATANDDNSWRLRVSGDDDGNPATTPPTNLDPGITIGQIYGSMQQNSGANACISTYELLGAGAATFNNFDMDGNTSVTYFPPRNGGPIAGTISVDSSWNVGTGSAPPPRDGDLVTVAANQTGYWRIETCLSSGNQFIQEGGTPFPGLFSLPLTMTLSKTDGVTTAQMGGYLQYTLTFTNTSVPTSGIAQSVVIIDTIPTNTTFYSASVTAPFTGTCSFGSGAVTCTVNENVTPGASGTVVVNVLVDNPAAGTTVVNNASLDYRDLLNAEYPRQTASDTDQLPSLRLAKTSANPGDSGDGPQVGDVITYTLTVSNPTAVAQTAVTVNDAVPAGTAYVANSTLATGTTVTRYFADNFDTNNSYAGSNGTHAWTGNWLEINEADGAGAGSERVTGNALRVGDNDANATGEGVSREASLAVGGGSSCAATLDFNVREIGLDAGESVAVSISSTGAGGPFTTLETFTTALGGAFVPRSYNVTAYIATNTVIRFFSNGALEGGEYLEVDNVALTNTCIGPKDNIPGGVNADLLSGVPSTLVQAGDNLTLAPGASATVTFQVTVTVAGPILNVATATSAEDPDPAEGSVRDVAFTRASIAGLRVSAGRVEFATAWQHGTAGFNLYASSATLRRAGKTRLNRELIKSPRPESMTPILYRVDADTTAPFLWIEEVELGSDSGRLMGPFSVDDGNLRTRFELLERRVEKNSEERGESRSMRTPRAPRVRSLLGPRRGPGRPAATGVKIEIARPGAIRVSWEDLANFGLPSKFLRDPGRLDLTTAGERVPFTANSSGLSFTARGRSTEHTANNVYLITWNGPPVLGAALSPSASPARGFERIKKNGFYYQAAPRDSDPWFWDVLSGTDPWPAAWDPTQGDFDLPGYRAEGGSIPVKIGLLGRTENEHHVEASINGVSVGSVDFSGMDEAILMGSVAASVLSPTGNRLTLAYSPAGDPTASYVFLSHMDLGVRLREQPGEILRMSSYDPALPRVAGADYLIVTHPDFAAQAAKIAALKSRAGRAAVVVDVERAYDRYTAGIPDASAVQALIRDARRASAVLLVGDDTDDPADNYAQGERVFVPSAIGYDAYTGRVASENLYADRDGDGAPDLAIGRLPVHTASEADAMVAKIENQEDLLARNQGRHVVAVDNQGMNDFAFRSAGRGIEAFFNGSVVFADVSLGSSAAREALLDGLQEGALTTTFVGHGAPDHWADEALFSADDAAAFAHTNRATVLLTWSCLASDYRYLGGPAVSEAMVLAPMGGAVASFGPTGVSLPTLQRELYLRLYPRLVAGDTLGEAARKAKAEMLAAFPSERAFLHGWVLLGDPDVRLPH
ncbi:MAG: DUF11 domain-containing protein, partial [Vicinamibacteria bacterium]|nr:DUF11 domain-containing protein [Vicinamibacteria bacterium]